MEAEGVEELVYDKLYTTRRMPANYRLKRLGQGLRLLRLGWWMTRAP